MLVHVSWYGHRSRFWHRVALWFDAAGKVLNIRLKCVFVQLFVVPLDWLHLSRVPYSQIYMPLSWNFLRTSSSSMELPFFISANFLRLIAISIILSSYISFTWPTDLCCCYYYYDYLPNTSSMHFYFYAAILGSRPKFYWPNVLEPSSNNDPIFSTMPWCNDLFS